MLKKILCLSLSISFLLTFIITPAQAQVLLSQDLILPKPGSMVELSLNFKPAILRGIKVNAQNPLKFDFILDPGDSSVIPAKAGIQQQEQLKTQTTQLIKYFLTTLTIPDNDIWVNLSPYEKDRIITAKFGQTEMGRNLLAQDYLLKQITASLMFPQGETGKKFWNRIYKEAQKRFGSTAIPVNTFNKVWIMPDKAVIYEKMGETQATAFVIESSLKVMLEEDYLALKKHTVILNKSPVILSGAKDLKAPKDSLASPQNDNFSKQIIREVMIPILQKEVNEGENFAPLRQVYNSILLALWYKQRMQGSILQSAYVNHSKIAGVNVKDKAIAQKIWQRYVQAYKKGVFNYIQEESFPSLDGNITNSPPVVIPRKYFAGGFTVKDLAMTIKDDSDMASYDRRQVLKALLRSAGGFWLVSAGCKVEQPYRLPPGHLPDSDISQVTDVGEPEVMDTGVLDTGIPDAQLADAGSQLDASRMDTGGMKGVNFNFQLNPGVFLDGVVDDVDHSVWWPEIFVKNGVLTVGLLSSPPAPMFPNTVSGKIWTIYPDGKIVVNNISLPFNQWGFSPPFPISGPSTIYDANTPAGQDILLTVIKVLEDGSQGQQGNPADLHPAVIQVINALLAALPSDVYNLYDQWHPKGIFITVINGQLTIINSKTHHDPQYGPVSNVTIYTVDPQSGEIDVTLDALNNGVPPPDNQYIDNTTTYTPASPQWQPTVQAIVSLLNPGVYSGLSVEKANGLQQVYTTVNGWSNGVFMPGFFPNSPDMAMVVKKTTRSVYRSKRAFLKKAGLWTMALATASTAGIAGWKLFFNSKSEALHSSTDPSIAELKTIISDSLVQKKEDLIAIDTTLFLLTRIFDEKSVSILMNLVRDKRIVFCKVPQQTMGQVYQLAEEKGDMARGLKYIDSFTVQVRFKDKPPLYVVIMNENIFSFPTVLFTTLLHELLGHIVSMERDGAARFGIESTIKAYSIELNALEVIRQNLSAIMDEASRNLPSDMLSWLKKALDDQQLQKMQDQDIAVRARYERALSQHSNPAMIHAYTNPGGIDLTKNAMPLDVRHAGDAVRFHIDPAQIAQIKAAPGFMPQVFSIKHLQSLPEFLGLTSQEAQLLFH